MIWLAFNDAECPVKLLGEKQAHHLVRKGHAAERDLIIGTLINRFIKPVGAAHYKHQIGR